VKPGEMLAEKHADECVEIQKAARVVGDFFGAITAMPEPPPVVLAFCVEEPDLYSTESVNGVLVRVTDGVKLIVWLSFTIAYRDLANSPDIAEKLRFIESTRPQAAYILCANGDSTDYIISGLSIYQRADLN